MTPKRPLNELFYVTYGNKFDLNKMTRQSRADGGVSFVGRSAKNLGVSATVAKLDDVEPYKAGLITVALGGAILCSNVQPEPFYTAQNVAVLEPIEPLTFEQLVYMCECIMANRFRYSTFGREANRTLRTLLVPNIADYAPAWLAGSETRKATDFSSIAKPNDESEAPTLDTSTWRPFLLGDIFDIKKGSRITKADQRPGKMPFIGAIDSNNGLTAYIDAEVLHPAGTITVNYNGNGVAEAYYQPKDYWCSDDVNALYSLDGKPIRDTVAMFVATVIRREKYRFSYGRKWGLERMKASTIKLPARESNDGSGKWEPDWDAMDKYIRRLPFSSKLRG